MVYVGVGLISGCQPNLSPPYPASDVIASVTFDWSTHAQLAAGSDNWPITWADDGHQYTSWGDGGGFGGSNSEGRVSLGVARIEGSFDAYQAVNVWGGRDAENPAQFGGKSYGIISVDGVLHMWVSPGSNEQGYEEARLYSSTDHGIDWLPASWAFSREDAIVNPTFCQFGKDYEGARDGYVYIYVNRVKDSSELNVQRPGEIGLMRVPKGSVADKTKYEYFVKSERDNAAVWSHNFDDMQPIFVDSNGVGWNSSVSYNRGLKRYFLITEHTETAKANIGIFDAPEPWGPWTTVYYGQFGTGSGSGKSAFFYNFSNKWLSEDGREFVLLFTGIGVDDSWNVVAGHFELKPIVFKPALSEHAGAGSP